MGFCTDTPLNYIWNIPFKTLCVHELLPIRNINTVEDILQLWINGEQWILSGKVLLHHVDLRKTDKHDYWAWASLLVMTMIRVLSEASSGHLFITAHLVPLAMEFLTFHQIACDRNSVLQRPIFIGPQDLSRLTQTFYQETGYNLDMQLWCNNSPFNKLLNIKAGNLTKHKLPSGTS